MPIRQHSLVAALAHAFNSPIVLPADVITNLKARGYHCSGYRSLQTAKSAAANARRSLPALSSLTGSASPKPQSRPQSQRPLSLSALSLSLGGANSNFAELGLELSLAARESAVGVAFEAVAAVHSEAGDAAVTHKTNAVAAPALQGQPNSFSLLSVPPTSAVAGADFDSEMRSAPASKGFEQQLSPKLPLPSQARNSNSPAPSPQPQTHEQVFSHSHSGEWLAHSSSVSASAVASLSDLAHAPPLNHRPPLL